MDRAIAQASSSRPPREPGVSSADMVWGAGAPAVVVVEHRDRVSRGYGHLFEYLGVRLECVRSAMELEAVMRIEQPMAVIWDLAGGSVDSGQLLAKVAEYDPDLALLIVADDNPPALRLIEAMVEILGLTAVRKLFCRPELHDIVEFLFQAGRKSGGFRVLSV